MEEWDPRVLEVGAGEGWGATSVRREKREGVVSLTIYVGLHMGGRKGGREGGREACNGGTRDSHLALSCWQTWLSSALPSGSPWWMAEGGGKRRKLERNQTEHGIAPFHFFP